MSRPTMRFRAACAMLAIPAALAFMPAHAANDVIPQSALTPSTQLYTDMAGLGIGSIVVTNGGGNANGSGNASGRNDDGFRGPINFNFTTPLNFFGQTYTSFFANNNGNMSFNSGISAYIPTGPTGASSPVISPWFGDVDTRGTNSGVLHLNDTVANQVILTWDHVGYFNAHDDKLNTFQLVVRGPDYAIPNGEGSIGFFYTTMGWEHTDTSTVAAIGFGNGSGDSTTLAGSSTQADLNQVVQNHYIWFNQNLTPVPPPPVSAIPEPETYALMFLGLAAVGLAVRRRNVSRG